MYTQKIDGRQVLLVAAIFAMGAVLLAGWTPFSPPLAQLFGWVALLMGVLSAWEVAATRYEFTTNELVIHSGATRQRIRYDTIEAVRLARGFVSRIAAPNSVRLLIGNRTAKVVALSPKDRDQFLHELRRAVPWLTVCEQ